MTTGEDSILEAIDVDGTSYPVTTEVDSPESSSSSSTDDDHENKFLPTSILSSDENDADVEEEDGDAAAKILKPGKKILRRKKKPKRILSTTAANTTEEESSKEVRFASVIATASDGSLSNDETAGHNQAKSCSQDDKASQSAFTVTEDDSDKSVEELRQTLFDLRQQMNVMKVDLSAEKALRRSKEKNLVKLAKQLGAKAEELEETERLMNEMQQEIIDMEESNKGLMDQVHSLTAKRTEEVGRLLAKIEGLQGVDNESLCNGSLNRATLGNQSLLWIKVRQLYFFVTQTLSDMRSYAMRKRSVRDRTLLFSSLLVGIYMSFFLLLLFLACVRIFVHPHVLSLQNGLCAPASPGTTLNTASGSKAFESPWWAPYPMKGFAYGMFCSRISNIGSHRPMVVWDGADTLTISLFKWNGLTKKTTEKLIAIENIAMATFGNDEILVWKKQKGVGLQNWWWPSNRRETYTGPWCQSAA